jgi:two-component system cell cycle response regulator
MPQPSLRRRSDIEPNEPALRALIVDDDEQYRHYVATLLARFGFVTIDAADGEEALEILRNTAPFDMLIVDFEMPRVTGTQLITAVRSEDRFGEVFAMMLTGRADLETKVNALRMGFDDFVQKGADELEVAAKISAARRLILRQRKLDGAVRELYSLATRDELTGLYNRRFFFAELDRALAEGRAANLVLFDLDDFKIINDTFGHLAGDRILRDVGSIFLSATRHEDLVARYGGDEFVMLIVDSTPEQLEPLAARIAAQVGNAQWSFRENVIAVHVTAGISSSALLPQATVQRLLSAADRDLYKNKWLRKHPDSDPSLYEYDGARDVSIIEFLSDAPPAVKFSPSRHTRER